MKKYITYSLTVALAIICGTGAWAQEDTLSMDVTFTGTQELFLKNAAKQQAWPKIKESVVEIPSIKYTLIPNKQQVSIQPKLIEPAKVLVEPKLTKLYKGHVRAGFGLYTTPLLDLHYMDGRSRNGVWGVNYYHLSSAGGVALEDSIPDSFSTNSVRLWGRKFLKKHAIEGAFEWDRDVVNYYGFDPYLNWDADISDTKQRFNNIQGDLQLISYHRDSSKVNYHGGIKFRNFRDLDDGVENNVDVSTHLRTTKGTETYHGDISINYNDYTFTNLNDSTEGNQDQVLIQVAPQIQTRIGNFMVNVGAGIWIDAQSERPFHFYPLAEASYSLLDDLFIPYVGVQGRVEQNTYRSITDDNPFVLNDIEIKNTNRRLELFGGIRGTLSSTTSFNARLSTTRFEDFMYFVNDSTYSPGSRFFTLYDDLTVFNLRGEVSINNGEKLHMQLRGDYFLYSTGEEEHPWYQPTTRVTVTTSYNLADKLVLNLDIFTEGQRKAKSLVQHQDGTLETDGSYTVDLKGYADVNLGVEYRYSKRLSAWVRFNNMFAARYQQWSPYNVQRFNAMLGASYSF
ncbi:hypothetical protein [Sanyastnella coralliicola]|uniref:hypothetical protein n=1 Tax=Sanyastnella coralliicola TaxID=3069118 RepID=UPI0027B882C0|nr:hypothetical protein [Longitalea sp. SCSIO 12813]